MLQQYGNAICQNEGDRGEQEKVRQPLISCIARSAVSTPSSRL